MGCTERGTDRSMTWRKEISNRCGWLVKVQVGFSAGKHVWGLG